jgi:hypothetical protein
MQEFFINQYSKNPVLRMELISDGRYDYKKSMIYNNSIQNADVYFYMKNCETGILKISKSKADIVEVICGCDKKYLLQYSWKERDVRDKGVYDAWFEIIFNNDLTKSNTDFPEGNLIVPIEEKLKIYIK